MDANTTVFTNPSTFILLGIPGLEVAHVWISIPFCTMYIIVILGNCSILFIVKREPSLHEPMYYFLCMLAVTDLVLCTTTLPKILANFWIGLDMFFIILSYIQILRTIFSLPSKDARLKTFGTCGSHICVISAFYIPALFGSLISRLISTPPHFLILIFNVYFLVPPMLNPIIYGMRTKQIRDRLFQLFTLKGTKVFS
ncbi:olfactory receptor 52E4-like [Pelodiscus sinensis]|uniref:olfactory receptor 52E4-like n=1 Tax=Pelodiscus sinensis TaxID=13735 RepID=UPI003F6AE656